MIRHSSTMVMIGESADINWTTQSAVQDSNNPAVYHYAPRLGARHGSRTADGKNAFANFAFMDGHVDLLPTLPIDSNAGTALVSVPGLPGGVDGMSAMPQSSGTEFTLYMDHQ
jgi:prepilin-type processing-associated H-X9-DG protein